MTKTPGPDPLLTLADELTYLAGRPAIERITKLGPLMNSGDQSVVARLHVARCDATREAVEQYGTGKAVADLIGMSETGISRLRTGGGS